MNYPSENLALLRAALKQNSIDAYIILYADPHLGENIQDHWQIIRWLTGFDGSAGTVVVTDTFAGLWTDSRYFIQAEKQLAGTDFKLVKQGPGGNNDYVDWLSENIGSRKKIAMDGRIFSITSYKKLETRLAYKMVNIRGSDVPYSPLLTSFAIVGEEQVLFFTGYNKIPAYLAAVLEKLGIVIMPYEECSGIFPSFAEGSVILLTPGTTSASLYYSIPDFRSMT